ncbi:MAG: hypothetical protein M1812_006904 [Candelaria pacifica]|nr:MAG: hypothetical protein M1812_006904 [Candelaria pacifica]
MPAKSKRRSNTGQVYASVFTPEQIHFKPQSRTVSALKGFGPSKSTRQQTLTQIDFISRGVPVEDDVALDFEELEEQPKRKRSKRHHEPSRMQPMERVAQANGHPESSAAHKVEAWEEFSGGSRIKKEAPTTPHKPRVLEIPSSQSPPETPFSTKSTKSVRSPTRSPLKEKSTNPRALPRHPLRSNTGNRGYPKLEVKSTLPWERDDSENSSLSTASDCADLCKILSFSNQQEIPVGSESREFNRQLPTHVSTDLGLLKKHVKHRGASSPVQVKSQIQDSDEEEDEDSEDGFRASQELGSRVRSPELGCEVTLSEDTPKSAFSSVLDVAAVIPDDLQSEIQTTEFDPGQDTQGLLESVDLSSSALDQDESLPVYPLDTNATTNNLCSKAQTPNSSNPHAASSPHRSSSPPNLRSESEELSAQLSNDILQYTQLQPWQNSLGSPINTPSSQHSSPLHPTSPSEISHESYKSASSRLTRDAHPSQATTVDITQPSRQIPQQTHSSSPHSSSPLQTPTRLTPKRGSVEIERSKIAFDQGMLTMSQLLPDSLMQDSLPLPPLWSQESFDED